MTCIKLENKQKRGRDWLILWKLTRLGKKPNWENLSRRIWKTGLVQVAVSCSVYNKPKIWMHNNICLTIGPILLFISFYWRAPRPSGFWVPFQSPIYIRLPVMDKGFCLKATLKHCGGGQVVSLLAFYSCDPSSNPTEVCSFLFCKLFVKMKNKLKTGPFWTQQNDLKSEKVSRQQKSFGWICNLPRKMMIKSSMFKIGR